jgi:hypothetical protein
LSPVPHCGTPSLGATLIITAGFATRGEFRGRVHRAMVWFRRRQGVARNCTDDSDDQRRILEAL